MSYNGIPTNDDCLVSVAWLGSGNIKVVCVMAECLVAWLIA